MRSIEKTDFILNNTIAVKKVSQPSVLLAASNSSLGLAADVYPGPQPISIERKHFKHLKDPYVVGVKNDGERFCLLFFCLDDVYTAALRSRKGDVYLLNVKASKLLYNGTILDGELVGNEFVIFDCPLYGGNDIQSESFTHRMEHVGFAIDCIKRTHPMLEVKKKEFATMNEIPKLLNSSNCDGLVFMPVHHRVCTGTHQKMFKWKPLYQNTIDFAIKGNKVYLQNGGVLTEKRIKVHTDKLENVNPHLLSIVECIFISDKVWEALKVRTDKTLPNSTYTYSRTLVNLTENIQPEEFICMECT